MNTTRRVFITITVVTGLTFGVVGRANARPPNLKVFAATYPQVADRNQMKCTVCHSGSDKTAMNNYGEALAKHIAVRERDEAKVRTALELTEREPSAIPGKTFGDLLKLGLLPASKPTDVE